MRLFGKARASESGADRQCVLRRRRSGHELHVILSGRAGHALGGGRRCTVHDPALMEPR